MWNESRKWSERRRVRPYQGSTGLPLVLQRQSTADFLTKYFWKYFDLPRVCGITLISFTNFIQTFDLRDCFCKCSDREDFQELHRYEPMGHGRLLNIFPSEWNAWCKKAARSYQTRDMQIQKFKTVEMKRGSVSVLLCTNVAFLDVLASPDYPREKQSPSLCAIDLTKFSSYKICAWVQKDEKSLLKNSNL